MVAFYGLALALMRVMKFVPDSPAGRLLNQRLVEAPLRLFTRMERHHLIFVLIIAALAMAGTEAFFALGSADLALVYALDVSLYLDGLMVTLALASLARTRSAATILRLGVSALAARLRRRFGRHRRRPSLRRPERKPSNDDERPAARPLAA